PRAEPAPDRLDLRRPRADARVQRAGTPRARVADGLLEDAGSVRRFVAAVTLVVVVVMVSAVALVATRGSGDDGAAGPTPVIPSGGPPAAKPSSPALARFYAQRLGWSGCGDGNECARLTVPLDYRQPSVRRIHLYVLRVPASGSRIGSLVVNPGGPGASGASYAAARSTYFGDPLLEHSHLTG